MRVVFVDGWRVAKFTPTERKVKDRLKESVLSTLKCTNPCGCQLNAGLIQDKCCLGVDRDCIYQVVKKQKTINFHK
jgi:hypothetical protein